MRIVALEYGTGRHGERILVFIEKKRHIDTIAILRGGVRSIRRAGIVQVCTHMHPVFLEPQGGAALRGEVIDLIDGTEFRFVPAPQLEHRFHLRAGVDIRCDVGEHVRFYPAISTSAELGDRLAGADHTGVFRRE